MGSRLIEALALALLFALAYPWLVGLATGR